MGSDRRRRKLVNIGVQKAIALRIVCHSILFVWSVLLICLGLLVVTGLAQSDESFRQVRNMTVMAIGIGTLVILPVILYDSVKFSHRMAGPVLRLKSILPRIGNERLNHVALRKNDFWQEFVDEVNSMLDRVEILRRQAEQARSAREPMCDYEADACLSASVGSSSGDGAASTHG